MNLFFARLTGKLMSTEKFEKHVRSLQADAKRYRELESGALYKEYLELKAFLKSEAFLQKKAELDKRKTRAQWKESEEARKEARFAEICKREDIVFMEKADIRKIEAMESWSESFKAPFHNSSLAMNGFKAGFWFKNKALKTNFSYVEEAQAYCEQNAKIENDSLSIITRKEATEAPAWDEKKGFIMHSFPYSSAIVNTGDHFSQKIGLFMAKVRATGKCHSAIYLVGEDRLPLIQLYHFDGRRIHVGITDKNGKEEEVLRSLPASDWQVLSVAVNTQEIIWMVNNMEVFRTKNPMPGQKLYFSCQSFAPLKKAGEGRMDIAWVRAFERVEK